MTQRTGSWWCLISACLLLITSCGRKDVNRHGEIKLRGEKFVSLKGRHKGDLLQKGIASWYGKPYHGQRTANGETYDMWQMTAAHKTLPFNILIKVVNKDNGRSVKVRINDRGPFVRGRIIDLSRKAARRLGIEETGTARVNLYLANTTTESSKPPIEPPKPPNRPAITTSSGYWTIQVGSFSERDRAHALAHLMKSYSDHVSVERFAKMFRVRVGQFKTKSEAGFLAELFADEQISAWIVYVE